MSGHSSTTPSAQAGLRAVRGLFTWALCWALMLALDQHVDLAALALLLVMAASLAALWLPLAASLLASAAAVLAFNWQFVPPRGTLDVEVRQHALLLAAMLLVSWLVAALMAAQRRLAAQLAEQVQQATQLRELGEALRAVEEPAAQALALSAQLARLGAAQPSLLLLHEALPVRNELSAAASLHGAPADAETLAGLWLCLREAHAMGPCTGRHEELATWYLPLRGGRGARGAVALPLAGPPAQAEERQLAHAQALCDQLGLALERAWNLQAAEQARQQAQGQAVRNALLASISHDYRTPLAALLGAASSLRDQGERLSPAQRQRLAERLVTEIDQLARMTDNTLQLARLESAGPDAGLVLRLDWESAEDIVGAAMRRAALRQAGAAASTAQVGRHPRLRARIEPGLPLLRCDALLLAQLLDNLIDNALKYSEASVELLARAQGGRLLIAVRDRGAGVPSGWQERIFSVFQRGPARPAQAGPLASALGSTSGSAPGIAPSSAEGSAARPGVGVGLAVCRAIARAHGGELSLRARGHGGSSFECWLPCEPPPLCLPEEGAAP